MSAKYENEPTLRVGILAAPSIVVALHGEFSSPEGTLNGGEIKAELSGDGKILWNGAEYDSLNFKASDDSARFEIRDVIIGVNFHWERRENQTFKGDLAFVVEKGMLEAVNIVKVEDYLRSVISSEMSATASPALLRAHAVISRSWLLAQIEKHNRIDTGDTAKHPMRVSDTEICRWQDREDHELFDVCADDHCQRYQGTTRQTTEAVDLAVNETAGMVLTDKDGELCDARFSKCCGGVFEEFENCWQPRHYNYLTVRRDSSSPLDFPDLRSNKAAAGWIESEPDAFCNTRDPHILGQVLNGYDRETADFYRWRVRYSQEELAALILRRSGVDYGHILALEPLERGTSGRIVRLRIVGTKRTKVVGKELEIRRTLSPSHLYSSAFTVHPESATTVDGVPAAFELRGAGWGHGVGLCQIGAAVMGALGYDYREILSHYFPGSEIVNTILNVKC